MTFKPFLKWAGGKHRLAPFIVSHIPSKSHRKRLLEPFCGSAAVSLSVDFDAYELNDSNPDLIGLYETLIQQKQDFIDYAKSFFIPDNNQPERFYMLRERFNNSVNHEEKSALFVYLNRHAFNGLCRYNSRGYFNVPFGRYSRPYFPETEMQAFLSKASRITLHCGDFSGLFSKIEPDDVIYCDPPYIPLSHSASFTAYEKNGFSMFDQERLAQLAWKSAQNGRTVLVSNHDTPDSRKLYSQARIHFVSVQRRIAAKGSNRKKVDEILAVYD